MCEFVCQVSILISAAAIVEEKSFLVGRIATRLTGRQQADSASGAAVAGILTPPRPQVQWRRGLRFASDQCRVVESSWWPRFLSPSPPFLSSSYSRLRLVRAAVWPLIDQTSRAGSLEKPPNPSQARGPSRPAQPVDPSLRRQSSARMGVSPASEEMPRKCQERHEPRSTAFQGPSQLQRQLLHTPETEMAIGSHHRKRGERMSVG